MKKLFLGSSLIQNPNLPVTWAESTVSKKRAPTECSEAFILAVFPSSLLWTICFPSHPSKGCFYPSHGLRWLSDLSRRWVQWPPACLEWTWSQKSWALCHFHHLSLHVWVFQQLPRMDISSAVRGDQNPPPSRASQGVSQCGSSTQNYYTECTKIWIFANLWTMPHFLLAISACLSIYSESCLNLSNVLHPRSLVKIPSTP